MDKILMFINENVLRKIKRYMVIEIVALILDSIIKMERLELHMNLNCHRVIIPMKK